MSKDLDKKYLYRRAFTIYFTFVLLILVVLYSTLKLQIEGRKTLFDDVDEKLPVRTVKRVPRMGEILDMNGIPLVTSVTFYDIHMDPTVVDQKVFDSELAELAAGLHRMYPDKSAREYEDDIRKARENKSRYLLIRKRVTNDERKMLNKLPIFNLGQMKGGIIDNEETILRKKPYGNLLSRTLGYYKLEEEGKKIKEYKVGIEGAFYHYLKGEDGEELEQRISSGWKKTGKIIKDAVEGANVITTIDKEIQEVAHSELEKQMLYMDAEVGCVIVMDVKTGFVRAIANLTKQKKGGYSESYNFAIGHAEVPGSTYKLASLMAGLEDEKFKITDKVNAGGSYFIAGAKLTDSNHGMGYGTITIKKAFEKSSNVIAQIMYRAYRSEPEKFLDRLAQFGLKDKLGIDLVGEKTPFVPKPGTPGWSAMSVPWMSIGYELKQSPLQTLAFYNAVANNGTLVRPQFVQQIMRSGRVVKTFKPIVLREQICSKSTLFTMKECLEGVMINGTGHDLKSSFFTIAGKTGTAKLMGENKQFNDEKMSFYQASFVGYFPANKPIYSCIVVISKPRREYYGARVSGTVFAEIANKVYASALQYHRAVNSKRAVKSTELPKVKVAANRDVTQILKAFNLRYQLNNDTEWIESDTLKGSIHLNRKKEGKKLVPDVIGMTAKDAIYLLESAGMIVKLQGKGTVRSQSIKSGQSLVKGQLIKITLN
ncbi:MAG: penicillin-binding protein [Flavobacteriales bacterium]